MQEMAQNWLLNAIDIGLILVDEDLRIIRWNNWMNTHSGISLSSVLNNKLNTVFRDNHAKVLFRAIEQTLTYRTSSVMSAALHRSLLPLFNPYNFSPEHRIYQTITTTCLYVPNGRPLCLIQIFDASTSIKREKALRDYSNNLKRDSVTDGLTGLFNRRYFDDSYTQALSAANRAKNDVSVLMIDIDFFKPYNDFYGHQAGDMVIQAVARALKTQIVRGEDTVARYGGEEFVIILQNTSKKDAEFIAQQLNEAVRILNLPHEKSSVASHITISIGICSGIPSGNENMLLKADEALYESKHGGRNRWSSINLY